MDLVGKVTRGEVISQEGVEPHWLLTLLLAEWTVVADEWKEVQSCFPAQQQNLCLDVIKYNM